MCFWTICQRRSSSTRSSVEFQQQIPDSKLLSLWFVMICDDCWPVWQTVCSFCFPGAEFDQRPEPPLSSRLLLSVPQLMHRTSIFISLHLSSRFFKTGRTLRSRQTAGWKLHETTVNLRTFTDMNLCNWFTWCLLLHLLVCRPQNTCLCNTWTKRVSSPSMTGSLGCGLDLLYSF